MIAKNNGTKYRLYQFFFAQSIVIVNIINNEKPNNTHNSNFLCIAVVIISYATNVRNTFKRYFALFFVCIHPSTIRNAYSGKDRRPIMRNNVICGNNKYPMWSIIIVINASNFNTDADILILFVIFDIFTSFLVMNDIFLKNFSYKV